MDVSPEEKQRIREKIEKLKQSKFKQQTLPAWRPVPTPMSTMLTFSIFSVIFLAIGIVLQVMSDRITELDYRYDLECTIIQDGVENWQKQSPAQFQNIQNKIEGPVYVYYQLDNFYQNHRRYVKSRDDSQLSGQYKPVEDLADCDPIIKVKHLWQNQKKNLKGDDLDPEDPAVPCGLVAKSFFNDTFRLYKKDANGNVPEVDGKADESYRVDIIETDIAWQSDIEFKFKNIEKDFPAGKDNYTDIQWQDHKNEHFIVWMRTAGLPNFRKLWGRIEDGLDAGSYELWINNQYQVAPFQGAKSFVLSTTNALGGKNYFLAVCYITVGTLCLLFAFVFCVAYMKKKSNNGGN